MIGVGENNSPPTDPNELFDGVIDEVRISNNVRSSEWIQTEYSNQNKSTSFIDVGIEDMLSP